MMKKITIYIVGITGTLLTAVSIVFLVRLAIALHEISETESIGIIGGADGPTAIFLTTSAGITVPPLMAVIGLIIGIVCIIVSVLLLKEKHNK